MMMMKKKYKKKTYVTTIIIIIVVIWWVSLDSMSVGTCLSRWTMEGSLIVSHGR